MRIHQREIIELWVRSREMIKGLVYQMNVNQLDSRLWQYSDCYVYMHTDKPGYYYS